MPRYCVHLFPIMHLTYEVEAKTPRQAITAAEALLTETDWRCAVDVDYVGDPNTEVIVDRSGNFGEEVLRRRFYTLIPVGSSRKRQHK